MIRLKRIDGVPVELLNALAGYGKREIDGLGPTITQVFDTSRAIWLGTRGDVPVFIAGVQCDTLILGARLWFMTCSGFYPMRADFLRFGRRALRLAPCGLDVYIDDKFPVGQTFVKFFGFKEIGPISHFIQFRREPWRLQQAS